MVTGNLICKCTISVCTDITTYVPTTYLKRFDNQILNKLLIKTNNKIGL